MEEITEKTDGKQPKPWQFQPGQSGNPDGRPKGSRNFTSKVREALEQIAEGRDYTYEEAFIKAILKKSIVDQDTGMMRTVWEQLDGKPLQRMANADGSNLKPLIIASEILQKNNLTSETDPSTIPDSEGPSPV